MKPIDKLITLLSFTHEWKLSEHTLVHVSGLSLWHCNGLFFYHVYSPVMIGFTFWEKLRLFIPINRCIRACNKDRLERLSRLLEKA